MKEIKDGWHILEDLSSAIVMQDPTGVEYTLLQFKAGKVITETSPISGFTSRKEMEKYVRNLLKGQLAALDRPSLQKKTTVTYTEIDN